jgi:integrase
MADPLEALLAAERCAALSGHDSHFIMVITLAYTGMRWSELVGLTPACVHSDRVDISWKLYELRRFYRGRPKGGSIRTADLPHSSPTCSPGSRPVGLPRFAYRADEIRAPVTSSLRTAGTGSRQRRETRLWQSSSTAGRSWDERQGGREQVDVA